MQAVGFGLQWDVGLFSATPQVRTAQAVQDISATPSYFSTLEEWSNARGDHCIQIYLNKEVITAFHLYYILPAWVILHLRY